jgi:uncharacterized membrane protein YbhN (UPF0104 family)
MSVTNRRSAGASLRVPGAGSSVALLWTRTRALARRHQTAVTVAGSVAVAAALVVVLAGRRDEFVTALSSATIGVLALAVALQVVALLARSEAWHGTICAAGGTVDRRRLYRASSMGYVASLFSSQVGVAARIAALRRSAPADSPAVATLVAAEFPILAVEAVLAALTSFTLVVPLGLPWWLPLVCLAVVGALSAGLRYLALRPGRELWKGLAVLRSMSGGRRLIGLVLVAVFAQILRNWMLLHAVGVDASLFDAIAVLIAMVVLGQLPVGPSVGAAAAVLILGSNGVPAVAAAGVLTTATGTIGGLGFATWAGLDRLWAGRRPTPARFQTAPATGGSSRSAASSDPGGRGGPSHGSSSSSSSSRWRSRIA